MTPHTAPSHYIIRCWLIINVAECNLAENAVDITHYKVFKNNISENTLPRGQWVKDDSPQITQFNLWDQDELLLLKIVLYILFTTITIFLLFNLPASPVHYILCTRKKGFWVMLDVITAKLICLFTTLYLLHLSMEYIKYVYLKHCVRCIAQQGPLLLTGINLNPSTN